MSECEENFDKSLSLIDVSFEDDCLYNSPPHDHPQFLQFPDDGTEHNTVQFSPSVQALGDYNKGDDGQVTQPVELLEQEKIRRNEKYNLRKSLAWDSAFFTSAGFLEPDELSSMIRGGEKGERKPLLPALLPGIEEDIHRSTDSISTLATDSSTLGTLEDDLFGDIRASIQKSSKASNTKVSQRQLGSGGVDESKLTKSFLPASEKVENVSQNKLKTKTALKKPNDTIKGSGKIGNQVFPSTQASKSASRNGGATSSLCKPPKIVGRPSAILATAAATKRASFGLGANRAKVEKDIMKDSTTHSDNAKSLTVRAKGANVPTTGGSRKTVPKPMLPVKSSLRSSVATKKQLTTTASIDNLGSLSSDSSSNHSLNVVKRKIDPKTSSTGSTVKISLRTASGNKNQPMSMRSSPYLKSVTKLPSSISPASSVSEWSSESLSPNSTLNKRSNSSRTSLDNSDASQVLDSPSHSSKSSVGHGAQVTGLPSERVKRVSTGSSALVHPDSIKPSGLRMPSPKIGFFDGVRSTGRTPTGSSQSHPTVPNDLPRFGAANVSPSAGSKNANVSPSAGSKSANVSSSAGSKNAKPGKLQSARNVVVRATKIGAEQTTLESQPKSSLPLKESPNAAPNISVAPRNGKHHPGITLKVQNRKSPNLKAEKVAPKECNTAVKKPDFGYVEMNDRLCKDQMTPQSKGNAFVKDSELIPNNGGSGDMLSQKLSEVSICGQNHNLKSISNVNEKGNTCVEDKVDGLAQQVGALDIEIQQKQPVGDCLSLDQVNESTVVNTGTPEEFVKSSIPVPTLSMIEGVKEVAEIDKSQ